MKSQIGFVGVGAMGANMALNLVKAGFGVTFFARETERGRANATRLVAAGAQQAPDLAATGRGAEAVILCLPDSPTVEAVLSEEARLLANLPPGALVIDCSTSHPESTKRLATRLSATGITLLDAPLTGSRKQAETAQLTVLAAGPRAAFERAMPIFNGFAARVFHIGPSGAGHTAKLINNYFGQLAVAGLCEAWPLIARSGLDPQALFDGISASGGNSATFQGLFPRLRRRDFSLTFAQGLARKDMSYYTDIIRGAGLKAPLAERLLELHEQATQQGYGERDFSSLLEFYEEQVGPSNRGPA